MKCILCDRGFPMQDGMHVPTQSLGMIPATLCGKLMKRGTIKAMFYESVWPKASGICFVKGRPHFHFFDGQRAPFNSGAPIALVAYGQRNFESLIAADLGIVLVLTHHDIYDGGSK